MVILDFGCRETEKIFQGLFSHKIAQAIQRIARRKLVALNEAASLEDMGWLPGNRLEALKGNRLGRFSIRINDQWRIFFRWTKQGPEEVEIVDYH